MTGLTGKASKLRVSGYGFTVKDFTVGGLGIPGGGLPFRVHGKGFTAEGLRLPIHGL